MYCEPVSGASGPTFDPREFLVKLTVMTRIEGLDHARLGSSGVVTLLSPARSDIFCIVYVS